MSDYHPTRTTGATPTKVQRARELRRAMTPEERLLWQELRVLRTQGYVFRRQQVIGGFIADFYCHAASLVVEVDGPIHENQAEYDAARDEVISSYGLRLLRVTNAEVRANLRPVLARILAACHAPS
jgi:very-short-patch-repair endonuclease